MQSELGNEGNSTNVSNSGGTNLIGAGTPRKRALLRNPANQKQSALNNNNNNNNNSNESQVHKSVIFSPKKVKSETSMLGSDEVCVGFSLVDNNNDFHHLQSQQHPNQHNFDGSKLQNNSISGHSLSVSIFVVESYMFLI